MQVHQAIAELADNKASGSGQMTAEHLKHAGPRVAVPLAIVLQVSQRIGLLPHDMLSVTLVPVIMDKLCSPIFMNE